jgi:hypothetical protein
MTSRPILFSGEMIRAILAGTKTQTRRVCKNPPGDQGAEKAARAADPHYLRRYPYGIPGDQLWVRETWCTFAHQDRTKPSRLPSGSEIFYRADAAQSAQAMPWWRPSIFMPRWASRLTLEITDVQLHRLQDCSEADAIAEGITGPHQVGYTAFKVPGDSKPRYSSAVAAYAALWDSLNEKRGFGWASNCWVWAVSFKRCA